MNAIDTALFLWINAPADAPAWALALARAITRYLPALALLGTLAALGCGPRWRRRALAALAAMALAWLAVRAFRGALPMPRPFELGLGHQWLPHVASASFPSFHATVAAAWATALGLRARHRAWPWCTAGVALAIAWSRVYLGLHFVSDVLAGMALGVLCALAVATLMRRRLVPAAAAVTPESTR